MQITVHPHALSFSHVQPGQVLDGKFRVDRVLGQGGFGVVVAATHLHLNETVALKFLLPAALGDPQLVGRFLREAQAAVRIKSEHVARVSDVGRLSSGEPYMVMEYLHGQDLAQRILQGPLPPQLAASYLLQALEAIGEAHSLGIIHRDLKPANLFLTQRADGSPLVKVLDFGISKVKNEAQGSLTATGAVLGSPFYMSPEQLTNMKLVDARSDIWALGVVFFELVTGKIPFPVEGQIGPLVAAILTLPPLSARQFRPQLGPEVDALVGRCLQKSQDARFQNVGQLAAALGSIAGEDGRVSVSRVTNLARGSAASLPLIVPPPAVVSGRAATGDLGSAVTQFTRPARSKLPLFVGLGAAAILLGVGGLALTKGSPQDTGALAITPPPPASGAASGAPAASSAAVPEVEPAASVDPALPRAEPRGKKPERAGLLVPGGKKPPGTKIGDTGRKDW